MSPSQRQASGIEAEAAAERFLHQQGLKTLVRNYQCRSGEIDLVMLDHSEPEGEVLVFVEVRFRPADAMVSAVETVDEHKQRKLIQAARHFLMIRTEFEEHPCRFDVIGLECLEDEPRWIANAFETTA
jgi:putative endonuclease